MAEQGTIEELAELLKAKMQSQPAPMAGAVSQRPTGVAFRMSIQLPDGSEIPAYLQFGPEVADNPQALQAAAMHVANTWPGVRAFPPRFENGGGYGGGGYGGGYRRRQGGYRRW